MNIYINQIAFLMLFLCMAKQKLLYEAYDYLTTL